MVRLPPRVALLATAVLLVSAGPPPASSPEKAAVETVDPFIGTGGEGPTFSRATAPFGMVQLSPHTDTRCVIRTRYCPTAGYRYEDPTLHGVSHTPFSGAGPSDLGDLP